VLTLRRSPQGVTFWIRATPRAARERVGGCHGDALRVSVTEPPVGGAANEACARALARALGVARRDVEIDAAARGRRKRVRVTGAAEALARRLEQLAGEDSRR
jgi:uncharacterized protein YggU (UPF0235/DUF167 family)